MEKVIVMTDFNTEKYDCPEYGGKVLPDEAGNCSLCGNHKA